MVGGYCIRRTGGGPHVFLRIEERLYVCLYCEQERATVQVVTLEVKEEYL